jgi:methionine sulfoxide reductase heme-binding subunit
MASQLFVSLITKQKQIITLFKILYIIIVGITLVGIYSIYTLNDLAIPFISYGKTLGQIAIILYILTLLPGVFRRFKLQHESIQLLMVYRRYIGILMYLFVFAHMWFLYWTDVIQTGSIHFPIPQFILMGFVAHIFLFLLFITSNDLSTKKLGIWWNRIHNLTYAAIGFIFLHVALQKISTWTYIIGTTTCVVLLSHLYKRYRN